MTKRILVIEDQEEIASIIASKLSDKGYIVDVANDGDTGLDKAMEQKAHLIVLDVILPKRSGIEILKHIRKQKIYTPVIILTTRTESENVVDGLSIGADDYVPKPFVSSELVARVDALIRRSTGSFSNIITIKDITVDIERGIITKNNKRIDLSGTQYDLFKYLVKNAGLIITREQIMRNIWTGKTFPKPGTIDVHINSIRHVLDPEDRNKYIKTAHGLGYIVDKTEQE